MADINLHFTGDFHAITTAHNLLSAMLDNHIHQGNALNIDLHSITWKRVMDMNERALREIVIGLGGKANGMPRQSGFDITTASEIMALLCLSTDRADLERRLASVVVALNKQGRPVTAKDLQASGAMAVVLKDAIVPNLVQTLEDTPAFVHGGPFGNIAHGCNSIIATRMALKLADYVVTEAGFGSDLGAEKFFDIKCRAAGLKPVTAVVVATIRALKMPGGVPLAELAANNPEAVVKGIANLEKHCENVRNVGLEPIVAINKFPTDTPEEIEALSECCGEYGREVGAFGRLGGGRRRRHRPRRRSSSKPASTNRTSIRHIRSTCRSRKRWSLSPGSSMAPMGPTICLPRSARSSRSNRSASATCRFA